MYIPPSLSAEEEVYWKRFYPLLDFSEDPLTNDVVKLDSFQEFVYHCVLRDKYRGEEGEKAKKAYLQVCLRIESYKKTFGLEDKPQEETEVRGW